MDANLVLIRKKVYDAIADLLGVYKVPTKTGIIESEAIAVLPHTDLANNYPTEGTELGGLECVIVPVRINQSGRLGGRLIDRAYRIILFQQNKNEGIEEAVNRLLLTDLQIIGNAVDIDFDLPKSKTYKVAALTVRYYSQVTF